MLFPPRSRDWLTRLAWLLAGVAAILPGPPVRVPTALAMAVEPVPVLTGVDPPGVILGETSRWTLTGRGLARVERFLISGTGIEFVAIRDPRDESIEIEVRASADSEPGFRELRAAGPAGVSNLVLFRVDRLPQSREAEPNNDPAGATVVAWNSALAGVLGPQDLDHFAFQGRARRRVTIEVEAWRLGSPLVPVATLFGPSGASLAQSRPLRDGSRDCRLTCELPADGRYLVQVRDALYRGGPSARYRLRIDDGPFATGLFPLGGSPGATIDVAASGGNLEQPWHKAIQLPDEPGTIVDAGPIAGPGGPLLPPARLAVGDGNGPEVRESPDASSPTRLPFGATANGRIDQPGQVDRYAVAVKGGETVRVEVRAAVLGSWLDATVTVDDRDGNRVAENDDRGRSPLTLGPAWALRDSRLDYEARADGEVIVAITDRFGDGGPAYAYRLSVGPPRPDFALTLRSRGSDSALPTIGSGAINLLPGTTTPLGFEVEADGRPGPITIRAEGLPTGVAADPVLVRMPRPGRGAGGIDGGRVEGSLLLKVEPGAGPTLGWLRVSATARDANGSAIVRRAFLALLPGSMTPDNLRPPPSRVVSEFPVMIVAPAALRPVGN